VRHVVSDGTGSTTLEMRNEVTNRILSHFTDDCLGAV
jgi:hypothetical protein